MNTARLLLVLSLAACGGSTATNGGPTSTTTASSAPVIAALKTHDGKVSIVGGGGSGAELRVNVVKDDGTVIADNASLDELRTKDPQTWMLVKSSVAQGSGTYLDATFVEAPAPTLK